MTRTPATTPPRPPTASAPKAPRPSQAVTVDPIRVLRQNLWLLIGTAIVGAILGVVAHFVFAWAYPLYLGEVRFVLKPPLEKGFDVLAQDIFNEETVVRLAQTEAARLVGRDNLMAAMMVPDVRQTDWAQNFRDDAGNLDVEEAVDELIEDVRAGHRRGQQIFFLTWRAHQPHDVPIVINAVADTYMDSRRREDDLRFNQSADVFRRQQQDLDRQILEIKKQVDDFIKARGLTKAEGMEDERRARELEEMARQITDSKKDFDIVRARRVQVEKRLEGTIEPGPDDIREADEDPVLMNARRDIHDLRTHLESMQQDFGPEHAGVRRLKSQLESAENNMKTQRDEIMRRNLRSTLKRLTDDTSALDDLLKRQIDDYTKSSKELEQITADLSELHTMNERIKQLQEDRATIASKLAEIATVRARQDAARVEIIQRARIPREMDFPNIKVMIPVVAILTLGVVLLFLFAREFLDQRVRYTSDLAGLPGGRLLGVIPDLADDPVAARSNPNTVVRDHPQSVVAEAYRQTAVQIAKGLEVGHKAIMIATGMPGGGATSVITNLAHVAKGMVGKVLVVDANFRQPGVASTLGANDSAPGLGDLLAGQGSLASVVQSAEGLYVVSAGTPATRLPERFNSPRLETVLDEARRDYDVVLIDVPPAVVAGEVMTVANRADASILVIHAWNDQRGLIGRLAHQLMDVRGVFLGVILNRPRSTAGGYFKKNAEAISKYAKARS